MPNNYFQFKQFTVHQDRCAMKVTTDACLFGSWSAMVINNEELIINNCLDIGAGTGLLSLMLAQKNPGMQIDAIEIDKDAFEQAAENITASPWTDRIKIIHADVKTFVPGHAYDMIISNPPFYENELKADKKGRNIAHHSEDLSLRELLSVIRATLDPTGSFYLLLPYKRHKEIRELMLENDLAVTQMMLVRQSVNHDYFRVMLAGKFRSAYTGETRIDELAIKDDKDQYSSQFMSLLSDYYLHL